MTLGRIIIIACFAILLGVPLLFRPSRDVAGGITSDDALTLIIITPHNEQIRYEFARAFDRWHMQHHRRRVKVVYNVPGGTTDIRKMLESQYTAAFEQGREPGGDADLVFGGGTREHGRLKEGVAIQRGAETRRESISQAVDFSDEWLISIYGENRIGDDPLYDKDKHWFGLALSGFGIVYNCDVLETLGVGEPDAWSDLCDPRLRGWVALVNPGQSGSVASAFESILKRNGWIKGWQILRRAAANSRYFSATANKPPIDVALGDAATGVCIDFLGRFQSQALSEAGDAHRMGYVDPPGGSTIDPDPISMLRGAPHPELAKRFIEFCLSEEGQALWQFKARHARGLTAEDVGPDRFELRRLPIRRAMYEKHADQMIDKVNPYEMVQRAEFPDANFNDLIRPMFAAMAIDNHQQLREAWEAIITHRAYPKDNFGIVTAENVDDPELHGMLRRFDALPVIAGPGRVPFDLADTRVLGELRSGWLRGGWVKDDLWDSQASPVDALRKRLGAFFREQYSETTKRRNVETSQ